MSEENTPNYERITFSHFEEFQDRPVSFVGKVNTVNASNILLDDEAEGLASN